MGTKWKSSISILVTCSILFTFGISGVFLLADNYGYYYAHKNYFQTPEFEYDEVNQFTSYLKTFEVNNKTLAEAKERITVSEEEIEEHRYRYGELQEQIESINFQYEGLIEEAKHNGNDSVAEAYIKERDSKIEDITKNFESDEHIETKIVKEKEEVLEKYYKDRESYRAHFNELKNSFQYFFKDTTTGKVYSNIDSKDPQINDINEDNMLFVRYLTFDTRYGDDYYIPSSYEAEEIMDYEFRTIEGRIGVPKNLSTSNLFMVRFEEYHKEQVVFWIVTVLNIISLFLSLIIFKRAKKSRAEVLRWRGYYDKIPIDVRVILTGTTAIFTFFMLMLFVNGVYGIYHSVSIIIPDIVIGAIGFSAGLTLTLIQLVFLLFTFKDWKSLQKQWISSLSFKLFTYLKKVLVVLTDKLKAAFLDQSTGTQILLLFGVVFVLGFAAVFVVGIPILTVFYIFLLAGVGIPILLMIINKIGDFNRIVENTNEFASGNLSPDLEVKGDTALSTLANNINVLKQGVKQSQTDQAKSERLKTELITNVSHDLRTPLTSIITYTELLKEQQDLGEESAAYLEVIDRKSKRLKVLIDDLFEVSKMASGNIDLKKAKVDLVQLLQQALGEYDDMINDSSLQFRVTHDEPPINAVVDGQKLWRVFDNLINNILKYSLEHSRVYINLNAEQGKAIITFKNISKYELNENTDELFERFKRGDTSRHTDGSGLGLAIAQSIVELHDGSLEIDIDGDLFKVTVVLYIED